MKFKRSYLLLIVISIFLLISIGSVCASENITDDSVDTLANDGTDVVLSSDTDGNVPDETSEEKINTTVETGDKYEFKQDANKTIPVEVKDNKSNKISVNKSDLSIFNGNKSISFEYNSSISMVTITEKLSYGYYNLTINYLGNATYVNSYKNITVKIYGNKTIETETSVVSTDGRNVEIPVKVYDQVEYVELIKENFNLTLVYTSETGNIRNVTITSYTIENGTIKFTTDDSLIDASVIIDYANATEPKTVGIKISTEVKAEKDKYKFKSEEIKNISINITNYKGNLNVNKTDLKVFDNGNEISDFEYNNTKLTLNLAVGVHNITVTYLGNNTYNASTSQGIIIKVSGNNTINVPTYVVSDEKTVEIPVTIFDGSENVTATQENFRNITLTYTNETGITTKPITDFNVNEGILKFSVDNIKLIKASVTINYVNSTGAKTVKINLNTTVYADAEIKYRFNETNNISIEVKDVNGNPLNIVKNDLEVFDNGNEILEFNFNNSILTVTLAEGVHNLTIVYKGNETYNSSSTTIEQKVFGDIKINPDNSTILDENNNVTITINLNDGADLVGINKTKLNVTVFYTINNQTKNKTAEYTLNGQKITFKLNDEFETAYANIKYDNLVANTTINANTEITASDLYYGASEVKNLTIEVKGTNGHKINITKDNIQILKDSKPLTIEVNNSLVTIKDAFNYGIYNLTIKFLGEESYLESSKNITLTVYGINATTSTNINSSKKGEIKVNVISGNETIAISQSDLNVTASYKDGNKTVNINVTVEKLENGTLYFNLDNCNFTTATLTIKFNNTEVNTTLNRIYNAKIEIIKNVTPYKTGNVTFRLIDADDGSNISGKTFKITIGTNVRTVFSTKTDKDGFANFKTTHLYVFDSSYIGITMPVGTYSVDLETEGDVKTTKVTTNITIIPATIKIVIDPYSEYYGSDKNVTMKVTNSENEAMSGVYLKLTVDKISGQTYYLNTDSEGIAHISVKGLVGGDYEFNVVNNDTKNINNVSTKSTVTIKKIPVTVTAGNVEIYYNTGTTYTIKVKKDGKALEGMYLIVRLYSTNTKYYDYLFQTNSKGQIAFSASLDVGKHKIIINSADNRYTMGQLTKTITVKKASGKITAKKVTDYYKGAKYFTVKLINTKNKKAIYNAKINIKVYVSKNRYYNYNGNTGMNGQIKLALDTLKPGTYKVVVSGADSKNFNAKAVTTKIVIKKAPTKFIAKKLTAKKGKNKYFKVTVQNKKTKKVIKKVKIKVKVYTGKKSKTYTLKTNSKGIAKLNVKKLKVGKHKVVIKSANKYCVAKAKKSMIKIKK